MQRSSEVEIYKEMRRNNDMNEHLRIYLFLTFIVSKTYEMSVSTSIQNQEILPVVGENITLACNFNPPSTYRQMSWIGRNDNILATCQGVGCRKEKIVADMSKYSLRADSSSGNLTIRDLTVDDSGKYRCIVLTYSDSATNETVLKVLLSGNVLYQVMYYNIILDSLIRL